MLIRKFRKSDLEQIIHIAKLLHPKWFDSNALEQIPRDSQIHNCLVCEIENKIVGFIVFSYNDEVVKINWLGVNPIEHRIGIGSTLLSEMEKSIKDKGIHKIVVETVIEQTPPDGSYDKTIKFYFKNGFKIRKKYFQKKSGVFTYSKGILEKTI